MKNKKIIDVLIQYMIAQLKEDLVNACFSYICINLLPTEKTENDFWKNLIEVKIKEIEKRLIKTIKQLQEDPFEDIAQLIRVNLDIESQKKSLEQNDEFFLAADKLFAFGRLALSSKKNNIALIFFYIASELKNHTDSGLLEAQHKVFNDHGYDNIAAEIFYFYKKISALNPLNFLEQLKDIKLNLSQHITCLNLSRLNLYVMTDLEDSEKFKCGILEVVQKLPNIKLLNLSHNNLKNYHLKTVLPKSILLELKNIQYIDLSSNKIESLTGLQELAETLKSDSILKIDLSNNKIICLKEQLEKLEIDFRKNCCKLQTVVVNLNLLGEICQTHFKEVSLKEEEKDANQKKSHPIYRFGIFITQALGKTKSFLYPSFEIDSDHWIANLICKKGAIIGHSKLCLEGVNKLGQRIFKAFDIIIEEGEKDATVRIDYEINSLISHPEEWNPRPYSVNNIQGQDLIARIEKEQEKGKVPYDKSGPVSNPGNKKVNCTSWCLNKLEEIEAKELEADMNKKPLAIPSLASKDPNKLCRIF